MSVRSAVSVQQTEMLGRRPCARKLSGVTCTMVRAAEGEIFECVRAAFGARPQLVHIDKGCVPATGHLATSAVAAQQLAPESRRDGLRCARGLLRCAHVGSRARRHYLELVERTRALRRRKAVHTNRRISCSFSPARVRCNTTPTSSDAAPTRTSAPTSVRTFPASETACSGRHLSAVCSAFYEQRALGTSVALSVRRTRTREATTWNETHDGDARHSERWRSRRFASQRAPAPISHLWVTAQRRRVAPARADERARPTAKSRPTARAGWTLRVTTSGSKARFTRTAIVTVSPSA